MIRRPILESVRKQKQPKKTYFKGERPRFISGGKSFQTEGLSDQDAGSWLRWMAAVMGTPPIRRKLNKLHM